MVTNNKNGVLSTIRSRCQIYSCIYNDQVISVNDDFLDDVKIFLNSIPNEKNFHVFCFEYSQKYTERKDVEMFFKTMLLYFLDCFHNNRNDVIDFVKGLSNKQSVDFMIFLEEELKFISSNVNINLVFDRFALEMRKYNG